MYKTKTQGTKKLERDISTETLLGVLAPGWHTGRVKNLSVSSTSLTFNVVDSTKDKLDTRIFIRDFQAPGTINPRMKAFLSAVCMDSNELMTLADAVMDGEFHMLGTLDNRRIKVEVGLNGEELDILRFGRPAAKKTLNF